MNANADFFHQLAAMRPDLLRFARFRLQDDALAEDAVQNTLIAVLEKPHNFSGRSTLRTYVTGILKFKILDSQSFRHRVCQCDAGEHDDDPSEDSNGRHAIADAFDHGVTPQCNDPERRLSEAQFFAMLERCLNNLPVKMAQVFIMRECIGMETDEICRELKISSANVWLLSCRARRALRLSPELNFHAEMV